jgi:hypothetical protein
MADMNAAPLQMRASGTGEDWQVVRATQPQYIWSGESAIVLRAPSQQYARANASKWFPWVTSRPFAFELWFQLLDKDREIGFEVALDSYDGHRGHKASFVWMHHAQYGRIGWQFWGPDRVAAYGNWEWISGGRDMIVSRGWYQWHRLVGAVDFGRQSYAHLQIDDHSFPIRHQPYEIVEDSQGPYCSFAIMAWSQEPDQRPEAAIGAVTVGTL